MSKHRLSLLTLSSFLFAFTSTVAVARTPDPCLQLRAGHGRQLQDLKRQQVEDLQQCEAASGSNSQDCLDLKERQKEEMRQLLERQKAALLGCRGNFFAFDNDINHYYHQNLYRNTYYSPDYPSSPGYPKHHYPDHDGDGDHHHHHHDHDGDHHHHYQGEPGHSHVATAVSSASRHDSGSHSGAVSASAIHSQWTHGQNSGSGWTGGGGSSSSSSGYSHGGGSGGSGGYSGGHSSGGYSGGGGGGGYSGGGGGGGASHSGGGGYSGGGSSASSGGGGSSAGGSGGRGVVK